MWFLIVLYYFLLFIAFVFKRERLVTFIVILYMFILFAFNTGNVDYDAYVEAFYRPTVRIGSWEIGFVGLMIFLNDLGLEVSALYTLISFLYVLTITFIAKIFTRNQINHFLFFLLISTFLLHVVQLRFSSAIIFILWGVVALLKIRKKSISVILFISCVLIASCFHIISVFFLFYLLPILFDIKKTYIYTVLMMIIIFTGGVVLPNSLSTNQFLFRLFNLVDNYSGVSDGINYRFIGCLVEMFIYLFIFRKIYRYQLENYKLKSNSLADNKKDLYLSKTCYGFSVVNLFFIPCLFMSPELHRVLSVVYIPLLCIVLYFTKIKQYSKVIYGSLFVIAIIISYCYIWGSMYNEFVFEPVLVNNSFLN